MSSKRVRVAPFFEIERGNEVCVERCAFKGCDVYLIWDGNTIHDGTSFWLDECHCHPEDRKRFCKQHRQSESCEACLDDDD